MKISIEELVARELKESLDKVIRERLGSYGSPLSKFIDEVVTEQRDSIKSLLREAISEAIAKDDFRAEVKSAFTHTLARTLMQDYKGEIEKQANALRQQADFRARVVLAIENIVKENAG